MRRDTVAVSLAQRGQPPCFSHQCVYKIMVVPCIDFKSLDDDDITPAETMYVDNVVSDVRGNASTIIDHGYTNKVDQEHISDIRSSIIVSIVNKRQLYLNRFM